MTLPSDRADRVSRVELRQGDFRKGYPDIGTSHGCGRYRAESPRHIWANRVLSPPADYLHLTSTESYVNTIWLGSHLLLRSLRSQVFWPFAGGLCGWRANALVPLNRWRGADCVRQKGLRCARLSMGRRAYLRPLARPQGLASVSVPAFIETNLLPR